MEEFTQLEFFTGGEEGCGDFNPGVEGGLMAPRPLVHAVHS